MNEPNDMIVTEDEKVERYVDEHFLVVPCPFCGHDCIWINAQEGWILCNAEDGSEEPVIHHCATPPDFLNVDEEDEEKDEQTKVS